MSNYRNYEYHSGANVVISVNDKELVECVGISYNVIDSSTPIYGYSSRLFDAVAPGQKVIQGSFVVNYAGPNSVFDIIKAGALTPFNSGSQAEDAVARAATEGMNQAPPPTEGGTPEVNKMLHNFANMKDKWWGPETAGVPMEGMVKDPTLMPNISIQIMFDGFQRGGSKDKRPIAGIEIYGVYLIGHGMTIQADESVLLEEYNFFGRTLRQLKGNRFNMGA